jgi:hypothetical protein
MEVHGRPASEYDVEVVDTQGRAVLRTSGQVKDGKLAVSVSGLAGPEYWVRVYPKGDSTDVVSEYRLRVR